MRRFRTQESERQEQELGRKWLGLALRWKRVAIGDSASMRAVTCSERRAGLEKEVAEPTHRFSGEGCHSLRK